MQVNADDLVVGLILRHQAQIRRLIERRCGRPVLERTTAEDLYQEVIAAALASAGSFDYRDDARFIGWMGTIARRTIARHAGSDVEGNLVRLRRDESSGVGVFASHLPGDERTPSSAVAHEETARKLRAAISALPEDYRRAVVLYRIEERSLSEVAVAMNRSKVATCRLLARAYTKLRKKLET